jgi:uncharacterized protein YkwD
MARAELAIVAICSVFVFSSPAFAQVAIPLPLPLPGPEPAPQPPAPSDCGHADSSPLTVSADLAQAATICLLNRERAAKGRPALRQNDRLEAAATGHAEDMVRRGYFAHDDPQGHDFVYRIFRARYVRRGERWILGENLAWGAGSRATPRETVRSWMDSSDHRRIVLNRGFRDIGIGVVAGSPLGAIEGAVTYASEYGARRKR